MFRKALSTIKVSAVLVATALALFQIQGCGGGGGGGDATPPQKDIAPPKVVSTTPAQAGMAVGTNSAITITFDEPIDSETVNALTTFTLKKDGTTTVAGTIKTVGSTALFKPTGDLSAGASYTATVTSGVKDLAGNALAANYTWNFTTPATGAATDAASPTVLSAFPAANSTVVTLNADLAVNFSEAIDPTTINPQTFTLLKNGTTPVTGTVTYVGTTALFKPASDLSAGASYTATITTAVKDLAGNALAANYTWNFTAGNASVLDTAPPQVLSQSVSPLNGATNVPVDSAYVVSFNEPIMPFEFGLIDGRPVAVTFNDTYTTVTMKPTVAMSNDTKYTASVKIKDMAGNQMPAAYTWSFWTVK